MTSLPVNPEAIGWIESYALCELSLDELHQKVHEALGSAFIDNAKMRVVNLYQICPDRAVRITQRHVEILIEKRRRREITEREMVEWGTMVVANSAYFWEDAEVAESVSFLHMDLVPED